MEYDHSYAERNHRYADYSNEDLSSTVCRNFSLPLAQLLCVRIFWFVLLLQEHYS